MAAERYRYLRPGVVDLLRDGTLFTRGERRTTRFGFADALLELGGQRADVVVLNADVSRGMGGPTPFPSAIRSAGSTWGSPSRT
jgi:hypothetical protein